jgi:PAS domain S-box-containing protein
VWASTGLVLDAALGALGVIALVAGWIAAEREAGALEHPVAQVTATLDELVASSARLAAALPTLSEGGQIAFAPPPVAAARGASSARELGALEDRVGRLAGAFHTVQEALAGLGAAVRSARAGDERARRHARSLLVASIDPVVVVGHDGTILDANPAAVDLLGGARDGLVGTSLTRLFADRDAAAAALEQARTRGLVRDHRLTLRDAGPGTAARAIELGAGVMPGDGAELPGLLVTLRDVSLARRTATDAERRMAEIHLARVSRDLEKARYDLDNDVGDRGDAIVRVMGGEKALSEAVARLKTATEMRQKLERAANADEQSLELRYDKADCGAAKTRVNELLALARAALVSFVAFFFIMKLLVASFDSRIYARTT